MTEPSGNLSGSSDSGHGFGRQTGSLPLGITILKSTDEITFRTERRDRLERIGILKAVYPATWGILQVATGPLSDRWGRKGLIVGGMWVQSAGLFLTAATRQFEWWLAGSLLLGVGTAMVYPSLIAAVSDASHPTRRARSLSIYRFWRDLGYATGALSAGIIADIFGMAWAIGTIAALTFLSGAVVAALMRERAGHSLDLAQYPKPLGQLK